jgi:hypothetical protein
MASCRNSSLRVWDHFRDVTKTSPHGSRTAQDVQMTRFGMYLLAMNGDPEKPEIAAAQRYFAIQTYRAEFLLPPTRESQPESTRVVCRPWGERLTETIQRHRLYVVRNFPGGSFSTYTATVGEILMIEDELLNHQIPLRFGDLPDGSIGRRWSDHWKKNGWPNPLGQAPLDMPNLNITVEPFVYGPALRARFDEWLNGTYIPECMPEYFANKKEWRSLRLSAASAADHASLRLTGRPAELRAQQRKELTDAGGRVPARTLPPPQ